MPCQCVSFFFFFIFPLHRYIVAWSTNGFASLASPFSEILDTPLVSRHCIVSLCQVTVLWHFVRHCVVSWCRFTVECQCVVSQYSVTVSRHGVVSLCICVTMSLRHYVVPPCRVTVLMCRVTLSICHCCQQRSASWGQWTAGGRRRGGEGVQPASPGRHHSSLALHLPRLLLVHPVGEMGLARRILLHIHHLLVRLSSPCLLTV